MQRAAGDTSVRTGSVTVKVTAPKPAPKPSFAKPVNQWGCPSEAPIKGNAPSKFYRLRGQAVNDTTTPEQGFATETAAVKAGFRKSKR